MDFGRGISLQSLFGFTTSMVVMAHPFGHLVRFLHGSHGPSILCIFVRSISDVSHDYSPAGNFVLGYVESIPGSVFLYAVMITTMMVLLCGYSFSKKLKSFKLEIVPLAILLYLQLYFWIVLVGVGRILGVY